MIIKASPPEHKYATIQAHLFNDQNTHLICVNTNSTTTFINAELILKDMLVQKTHLITVKGISEQKVINHYVDLPLYITRIKGKGQITMHTKAYVITGI